MAISIRCHNPLCNKEFAVQPYRMSRTKNLYCSQQCVRQNRSATTLLTFWNHVLKTDTCWLWQRGRMPKEIGYGDFRHKGFLIRAHRFAYEETYGVLLPGFIVCHHCDNPPCVRPDHLFAGTKSDNAMDAFRKGRLKTFANGLPNPNTILQAQDIPTIRAMRDTMTSAALGEIYHVSEETIRTVWQKRTWKHIS